jgi:hypothetical protein
MSNIYDSIRTLIALFFFSTLVLAPAIADGQPFFLVGNDMDDAGRSALTWADYDNDGDLDLLLSGLGSDNQPFSCIYDNDEGELVRSQLQIEGYKETSANWGDMDDDGDLDLLIAGNTASGDKTRVYRNDAGDFVETDPGIVPIQSGEACWMDFDNDGDLDVFVSGNWSAKIYENRQGSWEPLSHDFGYFSSSAADWGDFDNDGDLDLLILGDSGAGAVSKIFRNDHGSFNEVDVELMGLMAGSADWVDADNDGDLDVTIAGNDDALESQFYLYRNDGRETFTYISTGIQGFALGDADWGDYDNDGDLDLLYSGKCPSCGVNVGGIYRNEGDNVFFHVTEVFNAVLRCSLQWADYDNDGDLDFAVSGINDWGIPATTLYKNMAGDNLFSINEAPAAPADLGASADGSQVTLTWTSPTDDHTPQDALSYNIRLGLSVQGEEIVPSMAIAENGFRKVSALGNAGQMNSFHIENLEPGTYFWSVQAIDQAFSGSVFAPEMSFDITATNLDDISANTYPRIYPNPASATITISVDFMDGLGDIEIFDVSGRCHLSKTLDPSSPSLDVTTLSPGLYFARIRGDEKTTSIKLVIR